MEITHRTRQFLVLVRAERDQREETHREPRPAGDGSRSEVAAVIASGLEVGRRGFELGGEFFGADDEAERHGETSLADRFVGLILVSFGFVLVCCANDMSVSEEWQFYCKLEMAQSMMRDYISHQPLPTWSSQACLRLSHAWPTTSSVHPSRVVAC